MGSRTGGCEGGRGCRVWPSSPGADMRLLTLLTLCLPVGVLLLSPEQLAQTLEFEVLNTSVTHEQSTEMRAWNAYSLTGHNMRMVCKYRVANGVDHCKDKEMNNLVINPVSNALRAVVQDRIVEINRTRCSLTVEFVNMTWDLQGRYYCRDQETSKSVERTILVGDAPVKPRNVSVVYSPMHSIAVYLDPVKAGADLNASDTLWSAEYQWNSEPFRPCPSRARKCRELKRGLCQVCFLHIENYNGCGQYTHYGFLGNNITFRISVGNKFGRVTYQKAFDLVNWVRPNAVDRLSVVGLSPEALNVTIHPSSDIDQAHVYLMSKSPYPLALRWSMRLLSTREHSRLEGEGADFFRRYGFERNLEADEAALRDVLATVPPSYKSKLLWDLASEEWCEPHNQPDQHMEIDGLPIPGYHYSLSVRSLSRFSGRKIFANVSSVQTKETAPEEGPKFHDSFAYCESSVSASVTCVLYFQEIPRVKRGGARVNYTILLNGDSFQQGVSQVIHAESQDNSVLIHDLVSGGNYHVSMQAHNQAGVSPVATKTLHVHAAPPPIAPKNIVMEKQTSDSAIIFKLYWAPVTPSQKDSVQVYVHHCNATNLQLQKNKGPQSLQAPQQPLKCVTNMGSIPVNDTGMFTFIHPDRKNELTAAFFVSTVTRDGESSGLQKVGCFYTRYRKPGMATKTGTKSDSDSLTVSFRLPCGDDQHYAHGRPKYYAVSLFRLKDSMDRKSCLQRCGLQMQQNDYHPKALMPEDNLKNLVTFKQSGLEPDTSYCVGMNLAGVDSIFHENDWQCIIEKTTEAPPSYTMIILLSFLGVLFIILVIYLCIHLFKRAKTLNSKFGLEGQDFQLGCSHNQPLVIKMGEASERGMLRDAESAVLGVSNPLTFNFYSESAVNHPVISNPPDTDTGLSEVVLDDSGRYPGFHTHMGTGSPSDDDDDTETGPSGSETDEDESRSEGDSEESSSCADIPLLSASPEHPQHSQPHCPASDLGMVALLPERLPCTETQGVPSAYGGQVEHGEATAFDVDAQPESGACRIISFPVRIQTSPLDTAAPGPSAQSLSSEGLLPCQLSSSALPEHCPSLPDLQASHGLPTLSPTSPSSVDESKTSENVNGEGAGQSGAQPADIFIGNYSISDILHAAVNSLIPGLGAEGASGAGRTMELSPVVLQNDVSDNFPWKAVVGFQGADCLSVLGEGAKGGWGEGSAESEPLLLENIQRAADMCPWKGSVDFQEGRQVERRLPDANRDSACFSSAGSSSSKDTGADIESLTSSR